MRVIVTHEQPDFDALASLALARLLFPDAVATVWGSLDSTLTAFLSLYRDVLELQDAQDIDLAEVSELIVVDTSDADRIGPFGSIVHQVPVTLYDHHPTLADGIRATRGIHEQVGATVTLLTRELVARDIAIPAPVASLALLGVHKDTGSFSYDLTTPDDHRAAAHLLACGANLQLLRRFTREPISPDHNEFRAHMLEHARTVEVAQRRVSVTTFEYPRYVAGVSGLTNELLDIDRVDAAIMVVAMAGKTLVFARSTNRFDVAATLADAFGGAGHPSAAFARTDLSAEGATRLALETLARHATGVVRADALMTSPVTTVQSDVTVSEAHATLQRFGYNGLPVMDGDALVGVISRRDLDRALRHELGQSLVSGFMVKTVVSAPPTTSLDELEALVVQHNIGRVPIVEEDRLVGIVTRTDLIAARHRHPGPDEPAMRLLARLPAGAQAALNTARSVAGPAKLYLVGGTVRDALLDVGYKDLDLAVEGVPADTFGRRLQSLLGGELHCHPVFATCTLTLASGLVLDLATTREDRYESPGALPGVRPSTISKDLARRDFSINALALRVHPEPPEIIDPFGGAADLKAKQLRVLHPLSFIEDPTRILRGARLAGRLGLRFAASTAEAARSALPYAVRGSTSLARLRAELELTLAEPHVTPSLRLLDELGALETLFGLRLDTPTLEALDQLRRETQVPDEAYLLSLLLATDAAAAEAHIATFAWPQRLLTERTRLASLQRDPSNVIDRDLEALEPAAAMLIRAQGGEFAARLLRIQQAPARRRLRGSDVLGLGLAPGPAVGRVLDEVARARSDQQVHTFDDELELAKRLIQAIGS